MFQIKTKRKRKATFLLAIRATTGSHTITYHTVVCTRKCTYISGILQWGQILDIAQEWAEKTLTCKLKRKFKWYATWGNDYGNQIKENRSRCLQTITTLADGTYHVDDWVVSITKVKNI